MGVKVHRPSDSSVPHESHHRRANPPERALQTAEDSSRQEASTAVAAATSHPMVASLRDEASPQLMAQGQVAAHSSRPLHPEANPSDHPPSGPRHRSAIRTAAAHHHVDPDGHRRLHPPVADPFQSIDQTSNPMAQHHAGGVVDVHPSLNVTDAGAPTNVPVASRSKRWTHRPFPKPRETDP